MKEIHFLMEVTHNPLDILHSSTLFKVKDVLSLPTFNAKHTAKVKIRDDKKYL